MGEKAKYRRAGVASLVAVGLAMPALLGGCDDLPADPTAGLCCSDFKVGADLSGVDFGGGVKFDAFIQATGDFAGVATAMVSDLSASCKALAVDLGAASAPDDEPTAPDAKVKFWCDHAVAQIDAEVKAKGSITVKVQPPSCNVDVSVQASCEGKCQVDVNCDPGGIDVRCDAGSIKGKCEGSCSGSCQGSANLAVACEGACQGTCSGTCAGNCEGKCDGKDSSGNCKGQCEGSCDTECQGSCRGECTMAANANVACEGECKGGCDVEIKAPKCEGEIKEPSCEGDADCQASCSASAEAKAECKPPSVEIVASGAISAQAIGALKLHLPNIFLIAEAKAKMLVGSAQVVVDIGAKLDPGELSGQAVFCLPPVVAAIGTALTNVEASVSASASVVTSVGG